MSSSFQLDESTKCDGPECRYCNKRERIAEIAKERYRIFCSHPSKCGSEFSSPIVRTKLDDVYKGIDTYDYHIALLSQSKTNARLPTIMFQPHLNSRGFYNLAMCDEDTSACLKRIRQSVEEIRRDYQKIKSVYPRGWVRHHTGDGGRWESFPILHEGILLKTMPGMLALNICQILVNLHPGWMQNMFGHAGFSVIYPNTLIPTHTGPCNIRIRSHLALQLPDETSDVDCYIKVNGKKRRWRCDDLILFDDSYPHSIHYYGPSDAPPRVVFYLDFWHPDIERHEKRLLDFIYKSNSETVKAFGDVLSSRLEEPLKERPRCRRKCD